jgi:hypothetical protein
MGQQWPISGKNFIKKFNPVDEQGFVKFLSAGERIPIFIKNMQRISYSGFFIQESDFASQDLLN